MQEKTVKLDKNVFVKVFNNQDRTKYCAQLLNTKYVVCNLNDPAPWFDTKVFDQKPEKFTQYSLLTMEYILDSEFKWLFYAINPDDEPDDLHLADGWHSIFPIFDNKIFLYNPPMSLQLKTQ